jgi:hypothetical protein
MLLAADGDYRKVGKGTTTRALRFVSILKSHHSSNRWHQGHGKPRKASGCSCLNAFTTACTAAARTSAGICATAASSRYAEASARCLSARSRRSELRRTTLNESLAPQPVPTLACAILACLSFLPPSPSGQKSAANPFYNLGKRSAPRNAPSEKGVPTVFGRIVLLVLLINGFATTRTKSNMNPPSAVPDEGHLIPVFHGIQRTVSYSFRSDGYFGAPWPPA